MTGRPPAPKRALPAILIPILAAATLAAAAGHGEPPYGDRHSTPGSPEFVLTMWAGGANASGSEITARQTLEERESDDFTPFLVLGVRLETYPAPKSRLSRRFGFGIDLAVMWGEANAVMIPGMWPEEVGLTAGVLTPSLVVRFPGKNWEGYAGIGSALVWGSRLTDSSSAVFTEQDDDTDVQVAGGLAAYAGMRYASEDGWYFVVEVRWQDGENDFVLGPPRTDVHVDWGFGQIVIGSGYRF